MSALMVPGLSEVCESGGGQGRIRSLFGNWCGQIKAL